MSREEIVSKALSDIVTGQAQVLSDVIGAAVDQSAIEQKASDGTLSQGDLDTAVAAAVEPLNQKIGELQLVIATDEQALVDAHVEADAKLAEVTSALAAMTADDVVKTKAVTDLQGSVAAVQAALDSIKALLFPAPVPAPIEPTA